MILVGSTLPLGISLYNGEALPAIPVLALILIGLAIVLFGVLFNGKAGLAREKDEAAAAEDSDAPRKNHTRRELLLTAKPMTIATTSSREVCMFMIYTR